MSFSLRYQSTAQKCKVNIIIEFRIILDKGRDRD